MPAARDGSPSQLPHRGPFQINSCPPANPNLPPGRLFPPGRVNECAEQPLAVLLTDRGRSHPKGGQQDRHQEPEGELSPGRRRSMTAGLNKKGTDEIMNRGLGPPADQAATSANRSAIAAVFFYVGDVGNILVIDPELLHSDHYA